MSLFKIGCLDYTFNYLPMHQSLHKQSEVFFAFLSKMHLTKYHHYLERSLKVIASLGFDCVQVMCTHPDQMPLSPTQLALRCEELNLEIASIGGYWNIFGGDWQHFKKSVDYAAEAGAKIVCTHSGSGKNFSLLVQRLNELCDYAKLSGIKIAIENSPFHLVNTTEDIVRITKAVKGIGINMDPANLNCSGCDPVEAVKLLKRRIIHTHAKDSFKNELRFVEISKGDVNFSEYFKALKSFGYKGCVVIEHESAENPVEAVKNGKKFIKNITLKL